MAKARAHFSVWLTAVMAGATVVVVTGILLAPAVTTCEASGGSLGSCVRDRLASFISGDDAPSSTPPLVASSEPSSTSSLPGIETSSASLAAAEPSAITLAPPSGQLELGAATEPSTPSSDVALASPSGQLDAAPVIAPAAAPASSAALTAPAGTLTANASPSVPPSRSGTALTLAPQQGVLEAAVGAEPVSSVAALAEPRPLPIGDTGWGSVWTQTETVATATPVPLDTATLAGESGGTPPIRAASTLAAPKPKPASAPAKASIASAPKPPVVVAAPRQAVSPSPRRTPKADPRYPNVVVLPTPPRPSDSSFATLKLR